MSPELGDSEDEIGSLLGRLGNQHRPTDGERQRAKQRIVDQLAGQRGHRYETERATDSAELIRVVHDSTIQQSAGNRILRVAAAVALLGLGSLGLVLLQRRPPQMIDVSGYTLVGAGVTNLPVPVEPGPHEVMLAGHIVRFELLRNASLVVRGADHIVLQAEGDSQFTLAFTEQAFDGMTPQEWFADKDFTFQESGGQADGPASSGFDVFLSSQDEGASGCVVAEPCIGFAQLEEDPEHLALQLGVANRLVVVAAGNGNLIIGFQPTQLALPEDIVGSISAE